MKQEKIVAPFHSLHLSHLYFLILKINPNNESVLLVYIMLICVIWVSHVVLKTEQSHSILMYERNNNEYFFNAIIFNQCCKWNPWLRAKYFFCVKNALLCVYEFGINKDEAESDWLTHMLTTELFLTATTYCRNKIARKHYQLYILDHQVLLSTQINYKLIFCNSPYSGPQNDNFDNYMYVLFSQAFTFSAFRESDLYPFMKPFSQ